MEIISESEAELAAEVVESAEAVAPESVVELVAETVESEETVANPAAIDPVAIEPQAAKVVEDVADVAAVATDELSESSDEPEKLNDWEPENPFAGLGKELVHIRIGIYGILTVLLAHSAVSLFKQM